MPISKMLMELAGGDREATGPTYDCRPFRAVYKTNRSKQSMVGHGGGYLIKTVQSNIALD
jgi:hypothetical protein